MDDSLNNNDLPALYRSADTASFKGQRAYLLVLKVGLGLQVLAVTISLLPKGNCGSFIAIVAAVAFGLSLLLTIILKSMHYERTWYGGRAAAESAKTSAWRYAVCAEPYQRQLDERSADELFLRSLNDVIQQRKSLAGAIGGALQGAQISDKMRAIRARSMADRLSIYLNGRISSQRHWYATKAEHSRRAMECLFFCSIGAQAFTLVFAVIRVTKPDFPNVTSIFSVAATSFLAWLQAKKYQELAQSYAVAANELGLILERGRHVSSETELSTFVGDAESAISREHTLWVSRRDSL